MFKIARGREGGQAILNELKIANFPKLLMSSLSRLLIKVGKPNNDVCWTFVNVLDGTGLDFHGLKCTFSTQKRPISDWSVFDINFLDSASASHPKLIKL